MDEGKESELNSLRQILLFGTPTDGISAGNFIPSWVNIQASAVGVTSEFITKTKRRWFKWVESAKSKVKSPYEVSVLPIVGTQDRFVPEYSVKSVYDEFETVPGNHTTMVKMKTREDRAFKIIHGKLESVLKSTIARLPNESGTQRKMENVALGDAIVECDKYAASTYDSERQAAGRELTYIDWRLAEPACKKAVGNNPRDSRMMFQYGRALIAASRDNDAFNYVRNAAQMGHVAAIELLGEMYRTGRGVPKNKTLSRRWYDRAAKLGHGRAINALGLYAYQEENFEIALGKFNKARDAGYLSAVNNIATMYERGDGVKKDLDRAVSLYELAASQDNAASMYSLGALYYRGEILTQDIDAAVRWFVKSIDAHLIDGHHFLGLIFDKNWKNIEKNPKKSAGHFIEYFKSKDQRVADKFITEKAKKMLFEYNEEISIETRIEIQKIVKMAGYYDGSINGVFDIDFKAALSSYQSAPK